MPTRIRTIPGIALTVLWLCTVRQATAQVIPNDETTRAGSSPKSTLGNSPGADLKYGPSPGEGDVMLGKPGLTTPRVPTSITGSGRTF